jgi:hypothetical protein
MIKIGTTATCSQQIKIIQQFAILQERAEQNYLQ